MANKQQAKRQIDKFRDAAREHETDDDEKRFNERLRKIAKKRPPKDDQSDDEDKPGQ